MNSEMLRLRSLASPEPLPPCIPRKKSLSSSIGEEDDSVSEIDPELRYTFQRNFQVLSPLVFYVGFQCGVEFWWNKRNRHPFYAAELESCGAFFMVCVALMTRLALEDKPVPL